MAHHGPAVRYPSPRAGDLGLIGCQCGWKHPGLIHKGSLCDSGRGLGWSFVLRRQRKPLRHGRLCPCVHVTDDIQVHTKYTPGEKRLLRPSLSIHHADIVTAIRLGRVHHIHSRVVGRIRGPGPAFCGSCRSDARRCYRSWSRRLDRGKLGIVAIRRAT